MDDRDTFAAAAITGWLASQQTVLSARAMASLAYEYADAMLAARGDALRPADAAYTAGVSADVESKQGPGGDA